MNPLISVVVPVYNDQRYIQECIESALGQDYENIEVVVVDDGSTDRTPEIVRAFGDRVRYIRQNNMGTAAALNTGIRQSKGSLIAWLSSDDAFLPGKLGQQIRKLEQEPRLSAVYTDWIMVDVEGRELRVTHCPHPAPERFLAALLEGNFINGSTILIQRRCFEQLGFFDETLPTDSDGAMWYRLLKAGCQFGHVPIPLVRYRWHAANLSHRHRLHHLCKDRVRCEALRMFTAQDLFGGTYEGRHDALGAGYQRLAEAFGRQYLFRAARCSMHKALRQGFTFERACRWLFYRVMSAKPLQSTLLYAQEVRNRRLGR